jgi:hypothetical protein
MQNAQARFGSENMRLELSNNRTIQEIQHDFGSQYPFLKLEFYKTEKTMPSIRIKERFPYSTLLRLAGLKKVGSVDISDEMTVGELESIFAEQFGLIVQVSRDSGGVWLETTMTDKWSLHKQNEYGKEIGRHTGRDLRDYN